ncbi:MAG TPA: hypothetical protein VG897_04185 [Terriglobales bacterium]|nr:hypothetical protein [Terriglobales bacterium]
MVNYNKPGTKDGINKDLANFKPSGKPIDGEDSLLANARAYVAAEMEASGASNAFNVRIQGQIMPNGGRSMSVVVTPVSLAL